MNEEALIFGAALDYLDDPDHLELKLAFLTALSEGRVPPDIPLDPYDALAPMIVALANGVARRGGKIDIPSWLTPRPAWRDRALVTAEQYRAFMDRGGIKEFIEQCRLRAAAILPRAPVLIAVDHALAAGAIRAACERYGAEAVAVVVLDAHFDAIAAPLRAVMADDAPAVGGVDFSAPAGDAVVFSDDARLGFEDLPADFSFEPGPEISPASAPRDPGVELAKDSIPPDLSFDPPDAPASAPSSAPDLLGHDTIPPGLDFDAPAPESEADPASAPEPLFSDEPLPEDLDFGSMSLASESGAEPGPVAADPPPASAPAEPPPAGLFTAPLELAGPAEGPPPPPPAPAAQVIYHTLAASPRVGMRPRFGSGAEGLCGDFLAPLLTSGVVRPEHLFVAGVSDYPPAALHAHPYGEAYLGWIEKGVKVYLKKEALSSSFGARLAADLQRCPARFLYVSYDADVAASPQHAAVRFMDKIGLPEERVLGIALAIRSLLESERFTLAGLDLSEIDIHLLGLSAPNAGADRTAWLAARFAVTLLGNMTLK